MKTGNINGKRIRGERPREKIVNNQSDIMITKKKKKSQNELTEKYQKSPNLQGKPEQ